MRPLSFFDSKTVAITGASSGIGRALALELARAGANVIAIARNEKRLKELEEEWNSNRAQKRQMFTQFICDLRDNKQLEALTGHLSSVGYPDVLVHSAGVSYPNFLQNIPNEELDSVLSTNLIAPIKLTRLMLPYFQQRKKGNIAFVGSIAGEINILGYSVYGASKAGIFAFADSLRNELVPYDVAVSIIHPPDTDTPMLDGEKKVRPAIVQKISEGGGILTANAVAQSLMKGIARGQFKIFPDLTSRTMAYALRQFPRTMRRYLDSKVRSLSKAGS